MSVTGRIYVIGPVTGVEEGNRPAFDAAREELWDEGWEVETPHDTIAADAEWAAAMRQSITRLMAADAVAVLPGWEMSPGARIERRLARDLGIPVISLAGAAQRALKPLLALAC